MLQKVLKNYSFETIHLTLELQNHIVIDILYFDHICNYKCGRHSSVDLSMPTILRPWVLIPSTTSMLYSIRKVNCDVKRTNVNRKRGLDSHSHLSVLPYFKDSHILLEAIRLCAKRYFFTIRFEKSDDVYRLF